MKKYLLLAVIALSSCSANSLLYNNEYGKPVYQAYCAFNSIGGCVKKLGETCPTGFEIMLVKGKSIVYNCK